MRRALRPSFILWVVTFLVVAMGSSGCWWGGRGYRHDREYRREYRR